MDHKSVTIVANPAAGHHCHVFLLDKYISKLPLDAVKKDLFYCRALDVVPKEENAPWYLAVAVGKNVLMKMVKKMCDEAGIVGNKSNHSLRVAGASALFDAGVPERIIQQRTGHRSVERLRVYERVTTYQNVKVSKILTGEASSFGDCDTNQDKMMKAVQPIKEPKPSANPLGVQYNKLHSKYVLFCSHAVA